VRRRKRFPWLLLVVAAILVFLGTFGILNRIMGPNSTDGWFDFLGENNSPQAPPSVSQNVTVPQVAGLTVAAARRELEDAGLKVGLTNEIPSNEVAAGRVIGQGVAAGAQVPRDTGVNLDVSTGPQTVSSPSPTATARSSPSPTATSSATASSAQPSQQEDRQATRRPAAAEDAPKARADDDPTPSSPEPTAKAESPEGKVAKQGKGVGHGNSGPGNNGNSGKGKGKN